MICRDCHQEYHHLYPKSSPTTLFEFTRKKYLSEKDCDEVDALKRELRDYQDLVNYIIQMQ